MDWIEVTIYTSSAGIEPVLGRLLQLGVTGAQIEDEQEFNDFLANNKQYWDYVDEELREKMAGETRVKIYVSDNAAGRETLLAVRGGMERLRELSTQSEFGRLAIELANRSEEDWANNWKQYFKPLPVGKRILIRPEWEPVPADTQGRVVFTINPGMSFGTGAHETTRLCLAAAEQHVREGSRVLDLGCGSGILSVVALLLGAGKAAAVDIDPNAAEIALQNARLNGVDVDGGRYAAFAGDVLSDDALREKIAREPFDVVFANIVADVVIALTPAVPAWLAPDGVLIASGIIDDRRDEVAAALAAQGFSIVSEQEEKGWVCFCCKHPPSPAR